MIFDTHCHYNLEPLSENWQTHWQEANQAGVLASLIVGTSLETSQLAVTQATSNPYQNTQLYASAGIHPNEWHRSGITNISETIKELDQFIFKHQKEIIALGETGLDYLRLAGSDEEKAAQITIQKEAFTAQLALADKYQLPIILHVRDQEIPEEPTPGNAYWDALALFEKYQQAHGKNALKPILHCLSGPKAYVEAFLGYGAYASLAGNVTYPSAQAIRELVGLIPSTKLLLETDAPFLPPQKHRGKPCFPHLITQTAQFVHDLTEIPLEQIWQNSYDCFKLPAS